MWADWAKGSLAPVLIYQVFWSLIRTPEKDRNLKQLSQNVEQLKGLMTKVDNLLSDQEFVSGQNLGYGDLILGHLLYRYFTLDFERINLPNLARYYDRLAARPAYREHVMVSYDSLRAE